MFGLKNEISAVRYSLFITERCNKRCNYCDIPQKKFQMDSWKFLIENILPIIDQGDFDCYTITGGEPTLSSNLDLVFDIITKPVKVNTNGLFLDEYFEKYYDRIDEVGLHLMESPYDPIPYHPAIYDEKVTLYIPVDNTSYQIAGRLARENSKLIFNFIPHIRKREDDVGHNCLTIDDMKKLWVDLCDLPNVQASSLKLIKNMSEDTINSYRTFCQNSNVRYLFDFVQGRIYRCAKSRVHNDSVEMTEDNIMKVHNMTLFEPKEEMDEGCRDCYYFAYFFPYAMRNQILRGKNESRHSASL